MDSMKKFLIVDDEDLIRQSLTLVFHNKDTEIHRTLEVGAQIKGRLMKIIFQDFYFLIDMHLPNAQ